MKSIQSLVILLAFGVVMLSGCATTSALHDAVMKNDIEKTRTLIDKGADVNSLDTYGTPLFHDAILLGNIEIATLFIEKGANVNLADEIGGRAALVRTAWTGRTNIAKLLIQKGAKVNFADAEGITPLMMASQMGHTEMVKLLIQKGAKINLADKAGRTALMWASYTGKTQTADLLIKNGANPSWQNMNGKTASDFAKEGRVARAQQAQAAQNQQNSGGGETGGGMLGKVVGGAFKSYTDNLTNDVTQKIGQDGIGGQVAASGLRSMKAEADETERKYSSSPQQTSGSPASGSGGDGGASDPGANGLTVAQRKAAAQKCKAKTKQDTGNPQVDTGCSIVAFDVCIYESTGITAYNQEAKKECAILQASYGAAVCQNPCNGAARLP